MRGIDDAAYLREKSYLWAANDTNVRSDYSNETLLYAGTCERAAVAEKKGKEEKKSILYRRPLVFIPVHFACLYVSKFDIDSVCSPSCGGGGGGGGRKKKNVISRMNNLTSILFFRPVPSSCRICRRWKFREARVNFHWLGTVLKKREGQILSLASRVVIGHENEISPFRSCIQSLNRSVIRDLQLGPNSPPTRPVALSIIYGNRAVRKFYDRPRDLLPITRLRARKESRVLLEGVYEPRLKALSLASRAPFARTKFQKRGCVENSFESDDREDYEPVSRGKLGG